MNSRFRVTAPIAFSIGVNITITNPDVSVVVIMFTVIFLFLFFSCDKQKGPTFGCVTKKQKNTKKGDKNCCQVWCVQGLNDY